jgi:hypothetical protein
MSRNEYRKFYETPEYNIDQAREYEKTENSDDKRNPNKKRFTKSSTEADSSENKTDNREETEKQETPNLNQRISIEIEVIPDSNSSQNNGDALHNENQISNLSENKIANSPENQTHETTHTKDKSKKIFQVVTNKPETKHSRLTKDNLRIKVCRMAGNSMFELLKYRCKRKKLLLKDVNVAKLFGNIRKQKWFVKRKIKFIFASNHANKKIITKMIKKDSIFRKLVNLKFEDFYKNHFMINYKFLPKDKKTLLFLSHFETLEDYLEKEEEKEKEKKEYTEEESKIYLDKLKATGNSLIYEINGGGYYKSRCNRRKIRTKICFIRYK